MSKHSKFFVISIFPPPQIFLKNKIKKVQKHDATDIGKLMHNLERKDRDLERLGKLEHSAEQVAIQVERRMAKEIENMASELLREQRLKQEAFEKVEVTPGSLYSLLY